MPGKTCIMIQGILDKPSTLKMEILYILKDYL